MNSLKGFNQNFLTYNAKKLISIIVHCGIYEYLRIPCGIKNSPSHYQRIRNTIFPKELSEGWVITYIYYIIVCSETWDSQLTRLERFLQRLLKVNMQISLKKCHFAYSELKALGHVVSGLSLGIDESKVAAVTGALLNEEGLELSEQTYLWRAQGENSKDEINGIKCKVPTDEE
ncbi:hypothetical protein O181_049532 [Austropuccinia psidii MF-1]|uniref:Reverse transcriptase domain-containing protein n=1 Tax=Austropuccinia psidii MF-1 TaxID=1389203 RepID=A0A9Q3HMQ0_9BASI|nr:hypothetical protein [Austropuccinia psidii MF-1]